MINDLALKPLEYAINFAITLDPQTQFALHEFNQRIICFEIGGLPAPIFISGQQNRLHFSFASQQPAQVAISGSVLAFMRCLVHKNPMQELADGQLTLVGESELAEKLLGLFGKLNIDWEEQLSKLMGDVAAHSFYRFFEKTSQWGSETLRACMKNSGEYLQEEISVVAPNAAIADFINDIDTLRDDAQRLAARVKRLETLLKTE